MASAEDAAVTLDVTVQQQLQQQQVSAVSGAASTAEVPRQSSSGVSDAVRSCDQGVPTTLVGWPLPRRGRFPLSLEEQRMVLRAYALTRHESLSKKPVVTKNPLKRAAQYTGVSRSAAADVVKRFKSNSGRLQVVKPGNRSGNRSKIADTRALAQQVRRVYHQACVDGQPFSTPDVVQIGRAANVHLSTSTFVRRIGFVHASRHGRSSLQESRGLVQRRYSCVSKLIAADPSRIVHVCDTALPGVAADGSRFVLALASTASTGVLPGSARVLTVHLSRKRSLRQPIAASKTGTQGDAPAGGSADASAAPGASAASAVSEPSRRIGTASDAAASTAAAAAATRSDGVDVCARVAGPVFLQYMQSHVLPVLPGGAVVVLEASRPHCWRDDHSDGIVTRDRASLTAFLDAAGVKHDDTMLRPHLLALVRQAQPCAVEKLLRAAGHDVVFVPPHHVDLNALGDACTGGISAFASAHAMAAATDSASAAAYVDRLLRDAPCLQPDAIAAAAQAVLTQARGYAVSAETADQQRYRPRLRVDGRGDDGLAEEEEAEDDEDDVIGYGMDDHLGLDEDNLGDHQRDDDDVDDVDDVDDADGGEAGDVTVVPVPVSCDGDGDGDHGGAGGGGSEHRDMMDARADDGDNNSSRNDDQTAWSS